MMIKTVVKSCVMILICAAMLFAMSGYTVDTWSADSTTTALATTKPKSTLKGVDHESWDILKSKYKDTVGYIKVPGTTIDDVVVQGDDNDYYLRRSAKGAQDEYVHSGCYFADFRCAIDLCQNTVIYGHNLNDESVKFGQLEKYRSLDFYKKNPVIYFDTPNTVGIWKIVAIFMTNNNPDDGVIFYYRNRGFQTQETFLNFIERCRRRSLIDCPVDVKENDRIITLSTCDYQLGHTSSTEGRFVIIARQLRDGEKQTVDVSSAKLNDNPLMPEGYYKKYGGTMPYYEDEPLLKDQRATTTAATTK